MAAIESSNSSMPTLTNSCFDPNDIDAYINYDNPQAYPSPSSSLSPSSSRTNAVMSQQSNKSHASTPVSAPATTRPNGTPSFASQSSQLVFPAPSHEYDSYKQQTGLPPGGLANTMAMNRYSENMNFSMGNQSYMMAPNAMFNNGRQQSEEMIDFASPPVQNFSFRNTADMEVDAENPSFFFAPHPAKNQFVDPNVLEGEMPRQVPPNQVGRMYPGMHQQQAAMAKAAQQQQQQQQQEILRRQQQQAQQQRQQPGNKPQGRRDNDPAVEHCISQLLQQMRQSSGTPPEEGVNAAKSLHVPRPKKEEDEMDEDERLLASEEGKKLSSKERRQLRNKVSARAFRSRRKEYIGQLEGEVAAKTNEANDLRTQNRALMEENARLQDLTRMLLSSSHFSSFLNDMSANGGGMPNVNVKAALQQQAPPAPQPQAQGAAGQSQPSASKDASPANMAQDVQMQNHQMVPAGMTTTFPATAEPQAPAATAPDMNATAGWNTGIDMNFAHTPVFAVLEVPEGPRLDAEVLSGKSSNFVEPVVPLSPVEENHKTEVPTLERPPVNEHEEQEEIGTPAPDEEIDESDPCLALFLDQTPVSSLASEDPSSFSSVVSEKPSCIDLVVESESESESEEPAELDAATVARFERLCAKIEGAYQRVKLVTSHLD